MLRATGLSRLSMRNYVTAFLERLQKCHTKKRVNTAQLAIHV